jgi:hypothetical protein
VYSKAKLKSNGEQRIPLFQTIVNKKQVRQMLPTQTAVDFIQTHFYEPYQLHEDTKLKENIMQDLLPNGIISFLEVYK